MDAHTQEEALLSAFPSLGVRSGAVDECVASSSPLAAETTTATSGSMAVAPTLWPPSPDSASSSSSSASPVTVTPALSKKELKKRASLDRRRLRNREAMQRARQRDKDHMAGLRLEAQELEVAHRKLLTALNSELAKIDSSESQSTHVAGLQMRLEAARTQANKLMAQNLAFQEQIGERVKKEDRMEGLLKELVREQQAQERVYCQIFHESDSQLRVFFSQERATKVILTSRRDRQSVDNVGFADAQRVDLFGWTTLHRFQDGKLYFSFTKVFRNRSAAQMVTRNWSNEIKFVTYRSAAEAATQQYHIVQKVNDDTYLIAREKKDPDHEGEMVRLLYLRFRLFEADGSYAVVTQSVPQERSLYGDTLDKIWANEVCMWNHFTPVLGANGEEHCEIHMIGSSAVGDPRSVRTNVLETIMGLLRWENINVGPTLSLTQAGQTDGRNAGARTGAPGGGVLSSLPSAPVRVAPLYRKPAMAKLNILVAKKEELRKTLDIGEKMAEEIVKLRRKGLISSIADIKPLFDAHYEQVKKVAEASVTKKEAKVSKAPAAALTSLQGGMVMTFSVASGAGVVQASGSAAVKAKKASQLKPKARKPVAAPKAKTKQPKKVKSETAKQPRKVKSETTKLPKKVKSEKVKAEAKTVVVKSERSFMYPDSAFY
ncbi:hypothetical protein BBJ28_00013424 [Nothophytophthora sp. Chile5]|nr:hypothetical protein BBJ28_00013424 [Nothophytophthora sp. Chile5]